VSNPSVSNHPISLASCVIRGTDAKKGRTRWLAPGEQAVSHLHYRRIILDAGNPPLSFRNENQETGLICLRGSGEVVTGGSMFKMKPYDSLYVPRQSEIVVTAGGDGCDFAEVAADVEHSYPLKFVPYADVKRDPGLHYKAGSEAAGRTVNILIGKNVEAGRILAGITLSEPGNWTSWPPHEHAAMLEEAYIYIDMPAPAWGLQFVYTNPAAPEIAEVVREGDCVVMPQGYHPNVAAPGGSINFLWIMAAHREVVDRQFGVVNVQPEYAGVRTGLEKGR
jgi:5-deoxy-glucuronate isomerase